MFLEVDLVNSYNFLQYIYISKRRTFLISTLVSSQRVIGFLRLIEFYLKKKLCNKYKNNFIVKKDIP